MASHFSGMLQITDLDDFIGPSQVQSDTFSPFYKLIITNYLWMGLIQMFAIDLKVISPFWTLWKRAADPDDFQIDTKHLN